MERDDYMRTLVDFLELLPPDDAGRADQRRRAARLFRRPGLVPGQSRRCGWPSKPNWNAGRRSKVASTNPRPSAATRTKLDPHKPSVYLELDRSSMTEPQAYLNGRFVPA